MTPNTSPLLGWIAPSQRTQLQQDTHNRIVSRMPQFALTPVTLGKGESVRLFDSWKDPTIIAEIGFEFTRFHQLTGSCFLPGVMVSMADGSRKPIESITIGESVLTHVGRARKVIRPTKREYTGGIHYIHAKKDPSRAGFSSEDKSNQEEEVPCTADHQFLTGNGHWVEAIKLDSREIVYKGDVKRAGDYITARYVENQTVHCLEVEDDRSFIANGYSVHNCVGAGGGNALTTLIFTQRLIATNPTMTFIPWWPFNYGRSRLYMGDRNKGEGSMGSTFFKSLLDDGCFASTESGLPQFSNSDGLTLTRNLELDWSDGDSQLVTQYMQAAKPHPIGAMSQVHAVEQIKAAIINGYPCTFACNNYIGNASIQGQGTNACVIGYWDSHGPHQQSVHAYWEHPDFGPLYWAQNNWPGNTYPRDPAGGPICGCWVKEAKVEAALRLDSEVFPLSHLAWFPAQPKILEYFV